MHYTHFNLTIPECNLCSQKVTFKYTLIEALIKENRDYVGKKHTSVHGWPQDTCVFSIVSHKMNLCKIC